jgi:NAD(P)-dependent dehydrogenase (short-subunit alcohol dehydrogenase family)
MTEDNGRLANKVAIITGGVSGIGPPAAGALWVKAAAWSSQT